MIQKERRHNIMNSKAEYNRCALPRLTAKLGEKDLDKWREKDQLEMEKEASIEERIRMRKKYMAKKRAEKGRRMEKNQPMRKKRRRNNLPEEELELEQAGEAQEAQHQEAPKMRKESPKKRHLERKETRPPKKRRKYYDMKRYITCKKWQQEEAGKAGSNNMTTTTNKEPTVTTNTMPEEKDLTPATYHHHDNPEEGDGQGGHHHHEQNCKEDHGGAVRQEDVEDLEGVGEDWPEETTNTMGEQRRQPKMQEVGDTSCVDSMHSRMPTPYVWASQGGITPKESVVNLVLTPILLPDHMPSEREDHGLGEDDQDHQPVEEEVHLGPGTGRGCP